RRETSAIIRAICVVVVKKSPREAVVRRSHAPRRSGFELSRPSQSSAGGLAGVRGERTGPRARSAASARLPQRYPRTAGPGFVFAVRGRFTRRIRRTSPPSGRRERFRVLGRVFDSRWYGNLL